MPSPSALSPCPPDAPTDARREALARANRRRIAAFVRSGRSALELPGALVAALDDRDAGYLLFDLFRAMVEDYHVDAGDAWRRVRAALGWPSARLDLEACGDERAPSWRDRYPEHMALIDRIELGLTL